MRVLLWLWVPCKDQALGSGTEAVGLLKL